MPLYVDYKGARANRCAGGPKKEMRRSQNLNLHSSVNSVSSRSSNTTFKDHLLSSRNRVNNLSPDLGRNLRMHFDSQRLEQSGLLLCSEILLVPIVTPVVC